MRVTVICPEASMFDGEADSVVAPAYDGEVGILPRHAPFMTLLGRGTLQSVTAADTVRRFQVEGGFLQVVNNTVRVVAEHVKGESTHASWPRPRPRCGSPRNGVARSADHRDTDLQEPLSRFKRRNWADTSPIPARV